MKFKKKKNMLILKRLISKKENIKGKLYNFKTCKFQIEIFVVFLYIIRSVCVYSVNKHRIREKNFEMLIDSAKLVSYE